MLLIAKSTAYVWLDKLKNKGYKAFIKSKKPGPKPGPCSNPRNGRLLNASQEEWIINLILNYMPFDPICGILHSSRWDRRTIKELIFQQFGILMSRQTVGNYLKRWNFTNKKQSKRALEQDQDAVKYFKDVKYKELVQKAKKENAIIIFIDETGLNTQSNAAYSYSPNGKRSYSNTTGKKFSKNLIIALDQNGRIFYQSYDQAMNTGLYINFLSSLLRKYNQKIILIADNLKVHHAKKLQQWVKDKSDIIELHYFPAYSPELNPVEYINCYIKYYIFSDDPISTQKDLENRICTVLRSLQQHQKIPGTGKNFFGHEELKFMENK
jgi:transposase